MIDMMGHRETRSTAWCCGNIKVIPWEIKIAQCLITYGPTQV